MENKIKENLDLVLNITILPIYTLWPLTFVRNKFFEQLKTPAADSNIKFRVRI